VGRWANLLAVPAARLVRARAVCTDAGRVPLAETLALRTADAVVCESQAARDRCVRKAAVPASRVCVVHPGVDIARYGARKPDAEPLLVALGGLFARNGHVELLEAVASVRRSVPSLRVVLAGEGPMRPVLAQRIAFHGLRACVEVAGHVDDVPALLARAHAVWAPGVRATIEAMAAGAAVVSPWRELVPPECLVARGDAAALGERLLALLRDPAVGATLRKRAEKEFSLAAFGARLAAVYAQVLSPGRLAA
jgi:glycosyltransferase involved in cell wall biosynthesis